MAKSPLDHRQLEALYWVAKLGSFASAARKLNTSQPAISQRIRDLEASLGVMLFDRSRRRAALTPKGKEAVDSAEKILSIGAELQERLSKQESLSGLLRIGVNETVALSWLPQLVELVNEKIPNLVLEVHVGLTQTLWNRYERGDLELLLVSGPIEPDGVTLESLGTTTYTWMSAPQSGLPKHRITPADFEGLPIITHGHGSTMHKDILMWFQNDTPRFRKSDVCHSLSVMAALTVSGLGISMLPPLIYQSEIESGKLIDLEPEPPLEPLEFWAVYPQRAVSPLPAIISDLARQVSTFEKVTDELNV
ncbi:putative hydrogen peroxide-inducible genes activator [Roseovarius albus]|uniref:Putative hydrogen peroxide-inducible genes activator n=1 Tax=Roseovarius albus TaxID=1247867 RepID=A0A1X7AA37_9RHOB|nr:LysR family transcriptional regulator [Roseovarius albus]SLN73784.1 putative hydrogen peroxide-inducible genes activator [Roseovarius albus]